jgi:hypothetical protein
MQYDAAPSADSSTPAGSDAGPVTSPTDTGPTTSRDAGVDCAALLDQMRAAPIVPNTRYAGFDLTSGADPRGLKIEEANAAGCGQPIVEAVPSDPGYRSVTWGNGAILASYNADSHVIHEFALDATYRGTVSFASRPGGAYGDHHYEIGIGFVHKDGVDFPLDFPTTRQATASVNEIYDGLMATFMPSTPAVADCGQAETCLHVDLPPTIYFGVRPLHFYVEIASGTSRPTGIYNFWPGGATDCSTPMANIERMDGQPIYPADILGIGGLRLSAVGTSSRGMTWQEAEAVECLGVHVSPPDVGYGAIKWGPSGEVELEYNLSTNVAYKLFANQGYKGTVTASSADGLHGYVIGIGSMTKDHAPFAVDWSHSAAANSAVTELFNAAWSSLFVSSTATSTSADCVASSDCAITPDDGQGHSLFILYDGPIELGFIFARGTSSPTSIYTSWPKGR